MSFTSEIRPIGCSVLRNSFGSFLCIGVSTMPGATAFTRIPCFTYSIARLRVTASRPPFVIIGTAEFAPAIGCSTSGSHRNCLRLGQRGGRTPEPPLASAHPPLAPFPVPDEGSRGGVPTRHGILQPANQF